MMYPPTSSTRTILLKSVPMELAVVGRELNPHPWNRRLWARDCLEKCEPFLSRAGETECGPKTSVVGKLGSLKRLCLLPRETQEGELRV